MAVAVGWRVGDELVTVGLWVGACGWWVSGRWVGGKWLDQPEEKKLSLNLVELGLGNNYLVLKATLTSAKS